VFDKWEQPVYAEILSFFTGRPLEEIARGDRSRVMQWFTDPNGAPLNISIKRQQPAKGR
jgi:hypothetical protein